jgi:hypothetical protein
VSTWDRSGGNDDSITLAPGATCVLAQDDGPGQITHLWFTVSTPDLWWGRTLVIRIYWDGEQTPSVEAPLGDFLGSGNCLTSIYSTALFEAAPRDGLSLHSWFAMPYAEGFRITVTNDSPLPLLALYAYVDYESWPAADPELGRFHAWWNRERSERRPQPEGTYTPGHNLTGADNYLLVETQGRGNYIGASLYVHSDDGGWYGEGDDMTFIDDDTWPPSIHGTGTEDYFGTAWSPATAFSHLYYGQPIADRDDWAGFSSLYRLHVKDPMPFERSLRATIEQGHANDRADDWSSVAYWYQLDRTAAMPPLPPMSERDPPWPVAWRSRVEAIREVYGEELRDPGADSDRLVRLHAGVRYLTQAAHRRDWEEIDRALEWITDGARPSAPAATSPGANQPRGPLATLLASTDDELERWVAGRTAEDVLDTVAADWVARFDAEEAGEAALVIGLRLLDETSARQLTITSRQCVVVVGSVGHERLTLLADPSTLARWALGRIDPWQALLQGGLVVRGDGALALRLHALFPPYL